MQQFLFRSSQQPRPLPTGRWSISQRWNDLLYAHWPVSAAQIQALLPKGLVVDTFQDSAWLGIVPFWLDRIKFRGSPLLPGLHGFPDLNVRTYVRDREAGMPGMYFFSLDASSLMAVLTARFAFGLPYHWAAMQIEQNDDREFAFRSTRRLAAEPAVFQVRYRSLGPSARLAACAGGTLEHFLMERYCLYTGDRSGLLSRSHLQPIQSPLEEAEAEIEINSLARAIGLRLPDQQPVLHYSRRMAVYIWPSQRLHLSRAGQPVTVAVSPST